MSLLISLKHVDGVGNQVPRLNHLGTTCAVPTMALRGKNDLTRSSCQLHDTNASQHQRRKEPFPRGRNHCHGATMPNSPTQSGTLPRTITCVVYLYSHYSFLNTTLHHCTKMAPSVIRGDDFQVMYTEAGHKDNLEADVSRLGMALLNRKFPIGKRYYCAPEQPPAD